MLPPLSLSSKQTSHFGTNCANVDLFVSPFVSLCHAKINQIKDLWKPPFAEGLNCVSAKASDNMMVSHAIIGIVMDMVLMVLPIWMIWKNMIFKKKAIQVVLIFGVGIFVILTGIIRLWYIKTLVFAIDPYVWPLCPIPRHMSLC
jgi:hypothetical protein